LRVFLKNVPSPTFGLPHFALTCNNVALVENHPALDWNFVDFFMFFGTNKKLSIFFLSRLNQLYHRFIITVMLLLNFSKRCKFALTISFFFLLENIELVCIFDGHFVLEVIGLNN